MLDDMTLDEQLGFDVRVAEGEELARAVVAASVIDDLLRRAAEQDRWGQS